MATDLSIIQKSQQTGGSEEEQRHISTKPHANSSSDTSSLKSVCAWCHPEITQASHGICAEHALELFGNDDYEAEYLLSYSNCVVIAKYIKENEPIPYDQLEKKFKYMGVKNFKYHLRQLRDNHVVRFVPNLKNMRSYIYFFEFKKHGRRRNWQSIYKGVINS